MFTSVERLQTEIKKKLQDTKGQKLTFSTLTWLHRINIFHFLYLKESTKLLSRDVMSESITVTTSLKYIVVLIIYKVKGKKNRTKTIIRFVFI